MYLYPQEEYLTAYYEAYAKMLEASKKTEISQESTSNYLNGTSDGNPGRQVGMKSKQDYDDDGIEWEDESIGK